jgi:PAS domain S-box-containing protein
LRGVTIDISEGKRAEEAVKQAEEKYRSIFENAVEGIFQSTTDGRFISVNPAMARILGYESPEELMAHRTDIGTQHYVDGNSRAELERMLAERAVAVGYECEVYRKDRSRIWTVENVRAISDEGGAVLYYEGSIEDFTERKHAEDWLAAQYAVTRALADSAKLAEATPNILRAICETFGWVWGALWTVDAEADLLRCREIWHDPSVEMPQFEQTSWELTFAPGVGLPGRVWATGQLAWVSDVVQDKNFPRAQTAVKENLHSALAIPIRSGSSVLGVMEFLSGVIREPNPELLAMMATVSSQIGQFIERKRAEEALRNSEEQLRQAQKLEAIGMLAGGIAHDFNNLLTVIGGYSDLTLVQLREEDPLRSNINEVKKAAERAAGLTRQLLAFSRKQVLQPKVLDLNAVVSELEKLLRRLIGEDIGFRTVLESTLGSVKADPGQIEQIIMNLAVNARDAMPRGGKLTIETKNVDLDEYYAKKHIAVIPGPYVMLAVSDTGTGMDQQTQARIFDPFFTTKETGKGTGLGLSTVYGIVKQSGGNIWVYSEVGRGTTFKVYLPRVDEGAEEYKRSAETQVDFRGPETVLVAEDEEMVRKLACKVLEMSGYRVLEAANGGAALLICERHNEPIHLLITDVIMPEMSGRELADRLAQLRPEMKVLYMSGYTDNAIVHHGVLNEGASFIQKPFATHALARKVREVLDASK